MEFVYVTEFQFRDDYHRFTEEIHLRWVLRSDLRVSNGDKA